MGYTRGDILKFRLAMVLRNIKLHIGRRFVPIKITEEQRYEIGDRVVDELKRHGDPWKLNEEVPENHPGPR